MIWIHSVKTKFVLFFFLWLLISQRFNSNLSHCLKSLCRPQGKNRYESRLSHRWRLSGYITDAAISSAPRAPQHSKFMHFYYKTDMHEISSTSKQECFHLPGLRAVLKIEASHMPHAGGHTPKEVSDPVTSCLVLAFLTVCNLLVLISDLADVCLCNRGNPVGSQNTRIDGAG